MRENNRAIGSKFEKEAGAYLKKHGYEYWNTITDAVQVRLILSQETVNILSSVK